MEIYKALKIAQIALVPGLLIALAHPKQPDPPAQDRLLLPGQTIIVQLISFIVGSVPLRPK